MPTFAIKEAGYSLSQTTKAVPGVETLNGAKIGTVWDDLLPPKVGRIQLSASTLIITHIGRSLSDCEAGNHSHCFQSVARCHPDAGWKAMLH